MSETFDCRACGKCCFGQPNAVQVFPHDAELMGPEKLARLVAPPIGQSPATLGRPAEPQQYMRMVDGHCAALEISAEGRFTCTIHEVRPTVCRAFQEGGSACLEARAR